jgi:hypothetical protein
MGRPRKLVRDPEKPAREFNEIKAIVDMAFIFFFAMGGESLERHMRSLDRTAELYDVQVDAAKAYGDHGAKAYGPTITGYEARMSASTFARLESLRQKKMAQCIAWAEEASDAAQTKFRNGETPERPDFGPPAETIGAGAETVEEQAPEAGEYEFIDATRKVHPESMTTRIGQLLDDLRKATESPPDEET